MYAYKIKHGYLKDAMSQSMKFLLITDDKRKAEKYISEYVAKEIEKDKDIDDDGNLVNHWWLNYKVEELQISSGVYNVVVIK